ncbi:allophanate hydrolase [Xanthobacter tagetidis]|uniref:Allophanate hydrolase n=1 Tax=Xanthobacter tagetidis TaxID=60216 RepID=A0A3L7ALW1_9HYPH|nr:allophanate hydrolase [Xanthobacter tagetidis]MBB6309123.1 allophanate hydrolase [Xanthobacter tagetidis]RLP80392.1 allophanate hydrolase [Xanthobacter tagetidis]
MHTLSDLLEAHRSGARALADTVAEVYRRIAARDDPAIFITLRPHADVAAEAQALAARGAAGLPLYGIPIAVKDNIDVAGLPTTAACPAFAYVPEKDATAVARLKAAGALVIGKTNLDQFATGLVGVRSPYGFPKNPFKADLVPGGSSSGSAVAVASGIVPVALGTDTAGSGRVPAMLNNIVGVKPSLGLVPNTGLVPACRSLDCISVFALTVDDAMAVLEVIAGDDADAYSRAMPLAPLAAPPPAPVLGVLRPDQREFFGDPDAAAAYEAALARWRKIGARLVEIDFAPFAETARLLYEGPWVAERWIVAGDLIEYNPAAVHPITRAITEPGGTASAADAFRAMYRLKALRKQVEPTLAAIDAMVLPTAPTAYTVDAVQAEPILLNSRNGTYTNFVNLMDLCGTAVPTTVAVSGVPYGITLLAPAGRDGEVASLARAFMAAGDLTLGATGAPLVAPPLPAPKAELDRLEVCVFGAHLSGMALNADLKAMGGRFVAEAETAPAYRMKLLPGAQPRPGLVRVGAGGAAISGEVWSLPMEGVGRLLATIPAPLGLGQVELADGRRVAGFLAEAGEVAQARDITEFGGFRTFVEHPQAAAV